MAKEKAAADKAVKAVGEKPAKAAKPVGDKADKPAKKALTKSAFMAELATQTEMSKGDILKVFVAIEDIIHKQLGPKGPGVVALPGLFKLKATRVKAVKGGKLVPNRFKPGEMTVTKDKPAHTKIRARPLKALKEKLK